MFYWALITFSVALAAGLLGFGGSASAVAGVAQSLFFVFLLLAAILVAIKLAQSNRDDV